MTLSVKCPGCQKALQVPDSAAGKAVKCPLCGQLFKVPGVAAAPVAAPAPPPAPPAPRPPAPQPTKIPDMAPEPPRAARRVPPPPPEEDELELEEPSAPASSFEPIPFKAVVKGSSRSMKGTYEGEVSPAGIVLRQGKKVVEVPVGAKARYIKGSQMTVELEVGRVELSIMKPLHYVNQLTEDLVAFLNGDKQTLDARDYRMPWYLYVPVFLPIGIPFITRGGAIPSGVAAGLVGACFAIAQQRKLSMAIRIAAALGVSVAAYALLFVLIWTDVLTIGWKRSSKPVADTPPNHSAPNPAADIPALVQGVRRIDQTAIRKLVAMGPAAAAAVPDLKAMLHDDRLKVWAAEVLLAIQPGSPEALAALREGLKLPMPAPASRAACLLLKTDPKDKEALAVLARALKEPFAIEPEPTEFLGQMGPAAKPAIPALTEAMKSPQKGVFAARALLQIDPGNKDAPHALEEHLASPNPVMAALAARTLLKINPKHAAALAALGRVFKEGGPDRFHAVLGYGELGAEARDVLPELIALVEKPIDAQMVDALGDALPRIDKDAAVAALGKYLQHRSGNVRITAAQVLGRMGPAAAAAIPALQAMEKDPREPEIREAATDALRQIKKS